MELQSLREGRKLNYHVQLNAVDTDALFFVGTPVRLDLPQFQIIRNETNSYRLERTPLAGFSYDVYSLLEDPPEAASSRLNDAALEPEMRRSTLALPRLDPRVPELARVLTAGATTDLERARSLERHLRRVVGEVHGVVVQPCRVGHARAGEVLRRLGVHAQRFIQAH